MGKEKENRSYNKEDIKNRRDKNNAKRREKRERSQPESKNDYRRRKQHDREESQWEF